VSEARILSYLIKALYYEYSEMSEGLTLELDNILMVLSLWNEQKDPTVHDCKKSLSMLILSRSNVLCHVSIFFHLD